MQTPDVWERQFASKNRSGDEAHFGSENTVGGRIPAPVEK